MLLTPSRAAFSPLYSINVDFVKGRPLHHLSTLPARGYLMHMMVSYMAAQKKRLNNEMIFSFTPASISFCNNNNNNGMNEIQCSRYVCWRMEVGHNEVKKGRHQQHCILWYSAEIGSVQIEKLIYEMF